MLRKCATNTTQPVAATELQDSRVAAAGTHSDLTEDHPESINIHYCTTSGPNQLLAISAAVKKHKAFFLWLPLSTSWLSYSTTIHRIASRFKLTHIMAATILVLTFLLSIDTARSWTFFPGFYLSNTSSKANQGFLQPHLRDHSIHPIIIAETTSVSLEVGETALVPIFSETSDGLPIPVVWTLRNSVSSVAVATIDQAYPYTRNGVSYALEGFRSSFATNLAGPAVSTPVQNGLGCERRFYLGKQHRFVDGTFQSSSISKRLVPTIYLCLHGREVGKTQVLVGEAFPDQEITRQKFERIVLLRPPYLSQFSRTLIDVEVVEPTNSNRRNELTMIEIRPQRCTDLECKINVVPLNRGGERLSCAKDDIQVKWHFLKVSYKFVKKDSCSILLRLRHLPLAGLPAFHRNYQIEATVEQTRTYAYKLPGFSRTVNVEVVRQAFGVAFMHPVRASAGKKVAWARALCPMIVTPGSVFSCLISVVDETGNPPGFQVEFGLGEWALPKDVEFLKIASAKPYYACFKVSEAASDAITDGISGKLSDPPIPFWSGRILINDAYSSYLTGEVPGYCR